MWSKFCYLLCLITIAHNKFFILCFKNLSSVWLSLGNRLNLSWKKFCFFFCWVSQVYHLSGFILLFFNVMVLGPYIWYKFDPQFHMRASLCLPIPMSPGGQKVFYFLFFIFLIYFSLSLFQFLWKECVSVLTSAPYGWSSQTLQLLWLTTSLSSLYPWKCCGVVYRFASLPFSDYFFKVVYVKPISSELE